MKTNKKMMALAVVACAAAAAQAEGWRLTVGPAWRSRVKTEIRGAASTPTVPGSHEAPTPGVGGWAADGRLTERPDPNPVAAPGDRVWAIGQPFTETTFTSGTDTESPLGLKSSLGCDVVQAGDFAVGLDLRFAGYWNLRATGGATVVTRQKTDWWLFLGGPYPGDTNFDFAPAPEPDPSGPEYGAPTVARARLRADLYQIGLGPTVTWRAFSWLDAYAGAAALCNLASLDFDAGASRTSETQCRLGFAGEVGLTARLTESLGLYAEAGYEWVDRFGASTGGLSTRTDFSSLVVSAGVAVSF